MWERERAPTPGALSWLGVMLGHLSHQQTPGEPAVSFWIQAELTSCFLPLDTRHTGQVGNHSRQQDSLTTGKRMNWEEGDPFVL